MSAAEVLFDWTAVTVMRHGPIVCVSGVSPISRAYSAAQYADEDWIAVLLRAIDTEYGLLLAMTEKAAAAVALPSPMSGEAPVAQVFNESDALAPLGVGEPAPVTPASDESYALTPTGVDGPAAAPAPEPEQVHETSPPEPLPAYGAYPGVMIVPDEVEAARNLVLRMVTERKHALLDARADPTRRQMLAKAFADYQNLFELGAPIDEHTQRGYRDFLAEKDHSDAIERGARSLEILALAADLENLRWLAEQVGQIWPGVLHARSDSLDP